MLSVTLKGKEKEKKKRSNPSHAMRWTHQKGALSKWFGVAQRTKLIPKRHLFDKDGTACSKYDNHYRCNNQHNQENLHDHLISTRISTLITIKIII